MKAIIFSIVFLHLFILGCSKDGNPIIDDDNTYIYTLAYQFSTLEKPNSLVINEENRFIYISGGYLHSMDSNVKIQKYNFAGELLNTIIDFSNYSYGIFPGYSPLDITLDDEHNICVLARPYKKSQDNEYWEPYDGFCLLIHNSDGEFLKEYDYSDKNCFYTPESITFRSNQFFVTNSFSLFKISKTTEHITEISLPKTPDGSLPENFISDLDIDGDGNIWFVGQISEDGYTVGSYISKVDSDCNQLFKFHSIRKTGQYVAYLNHPSIAIDDNGIIYVTTFYCQSLEIYDSQGLLLGDFDFKKEINDHTLPIDLRIDTDENIYVLDTGNDVVYVLKKQKAY